MMGMGHFGVAHHRVRDRGRERLKSVGLVDGAVASKVIAAADRRLAGKEPGTDALIKSDLRHSMQRGWLGLGAMDSSERRQFYAENFLHLMQIDAA